MSLGEQITQIIVYHMEKLYGEPDMIEDYNIVVTDANAGSTDSSLVFLQDRAFVEVNIVEEDKRKYNRLYDDLLEINTDSLNYYGDTSYLEIMHQLAQDVVLITPIWDERYQMTVEEELTISGHPLSDIVRMLFNYDRLTSIIVFVLPERYNINTLSDHNPTWYRISGVSISVIQKPNPWI